MSRGDRRGRRADGVGQRLVDDAGGGRRARALRRGPRGQGGQRPPDARRDVRLRRARPRAAACGRSSPAPAGPPTSPGCWPPRRRCRCSACPCRPATCRARTRCCRSSRCRPASRSPRSPSARPGRPTPPCSPSPCWPPTTRRSPSSSPPYRAERHAQAASSTLPPDRHVTPIVPPATIGMLGGGQLGRYASSPPALMGYGTVVLDPDPARPGRPRRRRAPRRAVRRPGGARPPGRRRAPSSRPSSRTRRPPPSSGSPAT